MSVQGSIGNEDIILENAATESTLRQLLKSSKESAAALKKLAEQAGLQLEDINESLEDLEESTDSLVEGVDELDESLEDLADTTKKSKLISDALNVSYEMLSSSIHGLIKGSVSASDMFSSITQYLPSGVWREIGEHFVQLTKYQEENFESYQKLTNSGITFAGALNQIRVAAAQSYMTLNEFTDMYNRNSEVFMKLGGTVEEGSKNFAKLSSTLVKSDLGLQLQSMGFTTSQINQSMLDYLDITGGVNASELKNKKVVDQLAESSGEYMIQLDMLARLTGKSREELSDSLKKQAQDASVQAALMGMTKEEQQKHIAAMAYATSTGIAGAEDYYKSLMLGLPPMTEAGRNFMAMFGESASQFDKMAAQAGDSTVEIEELRESFFEASESLINDSEKLSDVTKAALIQQGSAIGASVQQMQQYVNKLQQAGDSEEERRKAWDELQTNIARNDKQAENMAKFNESMQKLSAAVNESFAPLIGFMADILGGLATPINALAEFIEDVNDKFPELASGIIVLTGAVAAAATALVAMKAAQTAKGVLGGITGGGKEEIADGAKARTLGIGLRVLSETLKSAGKAAPQIIAGASSLSASIAIIGVGIGAGIAAIGAGIAAASWLIGKGLPSLAEGFESFADIDGENLTQVGMGIAAVATGLAMLGVGTVAASAGSVISGLIDGIGSLFGAKSPIEKLNEYAELGPGLSKAATGLTEFTTSLENLINFNFDNILTSLDAMRKISKTVEDINLNKATDRISRSLETLSKASASIDSIKNLATIGNSLGDSAKSIDQYVKSIESLSQLDSTQLGELTSNITKMKETLGTMSQDKNELLFQNLAQGFSQLIGIKGPTDQFEKFINISNSLSALSQSFGNFVITLSQLSNIDGQKILSVSESLNEFSKGLTTSNFDNTNNTAITSFINVISQLLQIDVNQFDAISLKLLDLKQIFNNFGDNTESIQKLSTDIGSFLTKLNEFSISFEQLSAVEYSGLANLNNITLPTENISSLSSAVETLGTSSQTLSDFIASIEQLSSVDYSGLANLNNITLPTENISSLSSAVETLGTSSQTLSDFIASIEQLSTVDYDQLNSFNSILMNLNDNLNNNVINNASNLLNGLPSLDGFANNMQKLVDIDQTRISELINIVGNLNNSFEKFNNPLPTSSIIDNFVESISNVSKMSDPFNMLLEFSNNNLTFDNSIQQIASLTSALKQLTEIDFENIVSGTEILDNFSKNLFNQSDINQFGTLFRLDNTKTPTIDVSPAEISRNIGTDRANIGNRELLTTPEPAIATTVVNKNYEEMVEVMKMFNEHALEMITELKKSSEYQRSISSAVKNSGGLW